MDRSAERLLNVEMVIRQSGILVVGRKMLGQWITGDRLLRRLGQLDVPRQVLDVATVVHPGEEELLGVAENDGADARLLKPAVLLDDRNDPSRELRELRVELAHKLFTTGNVKRAGDFLEDDALPLAARQRNDVLAAMVGDEEPGEFLQLLDWIPGCRSDRSGRSCR